MRLTGCGTNGQFVIMYSGQTFSEVHDALYKDWKDNYADCKIANLSIADGHDYMGHTAMVVYEELKVNK